jgi:hypothetical protein
LEVEVVVDGLQGVVDDELDVPVLREMLDVLADAALAPNLGLVEAVLPVVVVGVVAPRGAGGLLTGTS